MTKSQVIHRLRELAESLESMPDGFIESELGDILDAWWLLGEPPQGAREIAEAGVEDMQRLLWQVSRLEAALKLLEEHMERSFALKPPSENEIDKLAADYQREWNERPRTGT